MKILIALLIVALNPLVVLAEWYASSKGWNCFIKGLILLAFIILSLYLVFGQLL